MNSILYYGLHFIVTTTTFIYIIVLLHYVSEYKFKRNISSIILLVLFIIINYVLDITNVLIFKNIFIILGLIIFIKLTSKLTFKRSVVAFVRIFIMILLCEILSGFIICYVLKINNPVSFEIILTKCLALLVLIIISYLIIFFKNLIYRLLLKFDISWLLITSIILLLITIGTLNFISTYNRLYNAYILFIVLLVFIVLGMISIVKLLKKDYKKKIEINNLKSKNMEVIKYIDEFKTYKHNLKYNLLAIKNQGNEEINKQIDDLLNNNNDELKYINCFKEIPSNLIHVFSNCLTITNENHISIDIKNSYKDKELNIASNNYLLLNEIIGNCLTNAVEAIPEEGGFILIHFYEQDHVKFIRIVNNFDNDIDFDKLGKINYSTKNRNSGFGLNSIFNNNEITVNGAIINNMFEMTITIPN